MQAEIDTEGKPARKVAAYGMDARSQKILSMVFKEKLNGACELVNDSSAEVVLFDMDGKGAESQWREYQGSTGRLPTIVLSIRPQNIAGAIYIKKPIELASLLEAINNVLSVVPIKSNVVQDEKKSIISQTLNAASNLGDRLDDDKGNILKRQDATSEDLCYDPEEYAMGYLQRAIAESDSSRKPVKLVCWNRKFIAYDPAGNGEIITDLSASMMRNLAFVPVDGEELSVSIEVITDDAYAALHENKKAEVFAVKPFVWKLALLTARGRIPVGINLDGPVYLQHWPNLTRMEHVPHSLRIAALWIQEPRSLVEIAGTLDVPQKNVFNFFSACLAIGLSGQATRKSDHLVKPEQPREHENRGLFSSIMQKLTGKAA